MYKGVITSLVSIFNNNAKPKLIKQLEKEHQILFQLYNEIESKIANKEYDKALKLLNELYYTYKKHIIFENNYLYTKLIKKYKDYDVVINFIEETKDEVNIITKMFERFFLIYSNKFVLKSKINEFTHDFIKLGNALKERIEFEEERLYMLY